MWLTVLYWLLGVVFYTVCVLTVATLIYEERDPSTTLAWVLVFILIPVVGFVLYLLFGRNLRVSASHDRRRRAAEKHAATILVPIYQRYAGAASEHARSSSRIVSRLMHAIRRQVATEPLPCTDLAILPRGAEMFERLYEDIENAVDHVHLEYFIWESDELTGRFCDLLADKVKAGVEVRVLYDWVGSIPYGKGQLKRLDRAGASVYADSARLLKLNYRNHRKIAVVDGRVAYTGGMNFGQEYVDGGQRFESWRDTSVRFGGPLVAEMQAMFATRWMRVTGEDVFSARYFPDNEVGQAEDFVWAQVARSGAESRWEAIKQAFLLAIGSAQERVRVQSPYFVPDQSVSDTMVAQALAGVQVELMMAGVHDKKMPWWAAFTYIDDLLDAGGSVYQYERGFFHAKAITVDGSIAVIGTANFDIRSFTLHDELSIFFYDERIAAAQDAIFDADIEACRVVSAREVAGLSRAVRFRNALARLASRVL
jgi:cardiolipin synthase